jgi:hypothetical protein
MKNISILYIITTLLLLPLVFSACQAAPQVTHHPIVTSAVQFPITHIPVADDVMPTPGGYAYRADVNEGGTINSWPPIGVMPYTLGTGDDAINIVYRGFIKSKAGETRYNIVTAYTVKGFSDNDKIVLYSDLRPEGTELSVSSTWESPSALQSVMALKISPQAERGRYTFSITIGIGDKIYGEVPCILDVTD